MAQHSRCGALEADAFKESGELARGNVLHVAKHLRRLAEDHLEVDIDRLVLEARVLDRQAASAVACRLRRKGSVLFHTGF